MIKINNSADPNDTILITGANGFIGRKLVVSVLKLGFKNVRCFIRPSGDTILLESIKADYPDRNIEIQKGNLLSLEDCAAAAKGISIVYHLAAGKEKTFPGAYMNSAVTTRNLLEGVLKYNCIKRFVNISSFAVYSNFHLRRNALLDENCPVDDVSYLRNEPYVYGKEKQDEIVNYYHTEKNIPCVTVRPGVVFGPGKKQIAGRIGIGTFGVFLHTGGSNIMPVTYVDNCADAIALAGIADGIDGEAINILDDDLPTSRYFLKSYKKHAKYFRSIYVPRWMSYILCYVWEKYSVFSEYQLPPAFGRRIWSVYWKGNKYSNEKAKKLLHWQPSVPMDKALMNFFEYCKGEENQK